jgi:glycosyltransferase 2 family protein
VSAVKKAIQFLLFVAIGGVVMYLVYQGQNAAFQAQCRLDGTPSDRCSLLDKLWNDFSTVNLGWMLVVCLAFTLSNIFRAWRWQMLFVPLGYEKTRFSNALLTILLGYFANLGFPRMGEVVRAGSMARYEDIPLEKVMGTLVIDRLMDFICLGIVVGLAFLFEGQTILAFIGQRPDGGGGILQNPLVIGTAVFFFLFAALTWIFRKKLRATAFYKKIETLALGFADGLKSVLRLRRPGLFLLLSGGIWLMFYLQCYFNLKAFGPTAHLGLGAALMVFVFGTLGFIIPSPGGMGTFHALAIAGLALYGISGSDGFSYANIAFFAIQIFYNLVAGVLSLVLLPLLNPSKPSAP